MKMMRKLSFVLLLSVPLVADNKPAKEVNTNIDVAQMMSDGKKIDFVALSELMANSTPGKEVMKELDSKRKSAENEIRERQTKIAKLEKDFSDKSVTMSKAAQQAETNKIETQKGELQLLAKSKEQEFQQIYLAKSEELFKDASEAISQLAMQEKVDAVIDIESGRPLYLAPSMNKTGKYLAQFEKSHTQKVAAAKNNSATTKMAAKTGNPSLTPTKKA